MDVHTAHTTTRSPVGADIRNLSIPTGLLSNSKQVASQRRLATPTIGGYILWSSLKRVSFGPFPRNLVDSTSRRSSGIDTGKTRYLLNHSSPSCAGANIRGSRRQTTVAFAPCLSRIWPVPLCKCLAQNTILNLSFSLLHLDGSPLDTRKVWLRGRAIVRIHIYICPPIQSDSSCTPDITITLTFIRCITDPFDSATNPMTDDDAGSLRSRDDEHHNSSATLRLRLMNFFGLRPVRVFPLTALPHTYHPFQVRKFSSPISFLFT